MRKFYIISIIIFLLISITLFGRFLLKKYRHRQFVDYEQNITEARDNNQNQQFKIIEKFGINDKDTQLTNEKKIGDDYSNYSTDGQFVFFVKYADSFDKPGKEKVIIKAADPKTFEVLARGWTKDKSHIYFDGIIVEGLDAGSFTLLGDGKYIKDKNSVYYENIQADRNNLVLKVENSDPETFVTLGQFYGKDKNNSYFRDSIIRGADINSLEVIDSFYAKDKNHVYSWGKIIEGADPKTFKPE